MDNAMIGMYLILLAVLVVLLYTAVVGVENTKVCSQAMYLYMQNDSCRGCEVLKNAGMIITNAP